ncbi:MAG: class I adenylate-forming enzyme family protein [Pseudomonadota bacterium]
MSEQAAPNSTTENAVDVGDAFIDPMKLAGAAMRLLTEDPRFKVGEAEIRGQTYRVFENAPPSLVGLFELGAVNGGDKDFIIFRDEVLSFQETWDQARRFANGLKAKYGVGKGDKVGIAMRNYPEFCTAYMGIVSLGAIVVPLNAWWKTEELEYAIRDSDVHKIVVDAKRLELLKPIRKQEDLTLILAREEAEGADGRFEDVVAAGEPTTPQVDIDPEDDFCIVYTSGSTGNPKGVVLTHRGAVNALMSWGFLAASVMEARDGVSLFGDNPGILLGIPLFHVTGSHAIFLMSWLIGRRIAMVYKWSAADACETIRKHELTNFVGVPAQSYELMDAAGPEGLPSLLDIGSGGAKRPPEHVKRLKERFAKANPSSGYGMSETNAIGAVCSLSDYQRKPDAAGKPVPPLTDIKIVGDDGDCAVGEVGEVWIRSVVNLRCYHNLPEATAKAITPDGWFRTGDLGKFDEEGFLYIVDRIKDLIIRGGENISCLEVEGHAYAHGDVAEACVFAVPDDVLNERVGMVVFPKEGMTIDPQHLRDFMAEDLANFKVPERIWISPVQLPRLGTAKFDKITIKRLALQQPPHWKA